MAFETWKEHFGLEEYPSKLRFIGTIDEIIEPKEITSTGNVVQQNGNRSNIWWWEPITVEPREFNTIEPMIKIDMSVG